MAVEPAGEKAETGLSVAEGWRGRGLGDVLLRELEKRAKAVGARLIYGDMLGGNAKMLKLAKRRDSRSSARPATGRCRAFARSSRATWASAWRRVRQA